MEADSQNATTTVDDAETERCYLTLPLLIVVLGSYFAIALLFLFGMAAADVIPFSNRPVSIVQVIQAVQARPLTRSFGASGGASQYLITPVIGLVLVLAYLAARRRSHRLTVALLSATVPAVFLPFPRGLFVPLFAPVLTAEIFRGRFDGEDGNEGTASIVGVSWWMLVWLALAIYEIVAMYRANRLLSRSPHHSTEQPDTHPTQM